MRFWWQLNSIYLFIGFVQDIEELQQCQEENCKKECSGCPKHNSNFCMEFGDSKWVKVYKLDDLLSVLRTTEAKNFMLVAGNTAKGEFYFFVQIFHNPSQYTGGKAEIKMNCWCYFAKLENIGSIDVIYSHTSHNPITLALQLLCISSDSYAYLFPLNKMLSFHCFRKF